MKALPREQLAIGLECYVALDSWAGRTYHRIRIARIFPRHVRAEWLEDSVFGRTRGHTYQIPLSALREAESRGGAGNQEPRR